METFFFAWLTLTYFLPTGRHVLLLFRYHELVSQYGELDPLAQVDLTPTDTAQVLIALDDMEENYSKIRIVKLNWTLKELHWELAPILGIFQHRDHVIKVAKQYIFYHHDSVYHSSDQMSYLDRTLLRYGIKDGDEIHIAKKIEWKKKSTNTAKPSKDIDKEVKS